MRKLKLTCFALAFAAVMAASQSAPAELQPITVQAETNEVADSGKCGENVTWTLHKDGTLVISGSGPMYDYSGRTPGYFEEDKDGGYSTDAVKQVVVEEGVTRIGAYAFYYGNFTSISLPQGLKSIGEDAFANTQITSIEIPDTVTEIESGAFYISSIESIVIPDSITTIAKNTFEESELVSVTIPESVTTIEAYAFFNCGDLKNVIVPKSVTSIGKEALGYGIMDDEGVYPEFSITGYAGSEANKYAVKNGITFNAYECSTGHKYGSWKVAKQPTALAKGTEERACSVCGNKEKKSIDKLKPTAKLTASTVTLKVKQSTKGFKVSGMAKGDYVKSWKSSNTKIAYTVGSRNGTCKLVAKDKTGTVNVTVTLASGLKKTFKIKVQKSTVRTTKIRVPSTSVSVVKGKTFTLKPTRTPFTSQEKITYKSSNTKIATVSSAGKITGKKKGTAYVTVKSGKKSVKVKVTVK